MSLFYKIIGTLSAAEQSALQSKLVDWGKKHPYGERVAKNIYLENSIPDFVLKNLLLFIANDVSFSTKEFENKYQAECYKYPRMGENINWVDRPLYFGAAVEIDSFKKHLMDNYPKQFQNEKKADDFVLNLKSGTLSRFRKNILLKKYSVWTTWNESNYADEPFEFCSTTFANEIRANMGLNKMIISKELLLFVYSIPISIEVKRPTIADAELSQYFEPPVPGNKHGLTRTWELDPTMSGYNLDPRPEGIHQGMELSNLNLPLKTKW